MSREATGRLLCQADFLVQTEPFFPGAALSSIPRELLEEFHLLYPSPNTIHLGLSFVRQIYPEIHFLYLPNSVEYRFFKYVPTNF